MRPIKFRAWDNRDNRMYFAFPNWCFSLDGDIFDRANTMIDLKKHIEIMQYTGLKDKNGVEIYEGDIVSETQGFGDHYIMEVFWDDAEWMLGKTKRRYKTAIGKNTVYQVEVIGNIYENKELINKEKI